ncbi:hypothetical protein Tco_0513720 [Tanacetum coccineum]
MSKRLYLYKNGAFRDVSSADNEMTEVKVLMALADDENVVVGKESARNGEWVKIYKKAKDIKVSIRGIERHWLSKAKGFILPNHDIGRILPAESQVNTIDPPVAVTDSLTTEYDSVDKSLVCSTPIHLLEKLAGAEPISGPNTIKLILKSNSTFKADALKGVIVNKPSSAPAKLKASALKTPAGKLKNGKSEYDFPLASVMKELNDLKS